MGIRGFVIACVLAAAGVGRAQPAVTTDASTSAAAAGSAVGSAASAIGSTALAADDDGEISDRGRLVHLGVTVAMGGAYLIAEFALARQLSPTACNWCNPDRFDADVRNTLVWHDTAAASLASNLTGYVTAPIAATGLLLLAGGRRSWRRHYDDVVPIIQSAIAVSLLQHVTKVLAARQRPFVHFAAPGTLAPSEEDNVSFFSGHTSLCFSLAVSSGVIASTRGYRLAPLVWAVGLTIAATTGYLRIAADAHYATDVLTGAAMGSLVGYLWPRFVHRYIWHHHVDVVPSGSGLAIAGTF